MPRTALPITDLTENAGTTPASSAVDPTNGHTIAAGGKTDKIFLRVNNTNAGAKNVTVKAGVNPPAFRQGLGDLVVSVPATTGERYIGPLESARFAQADGSISVDCEAAMTGTISAYRMPRN